jgi:hypothetical protein
MRRAKSYGTFYSERCGIIQVCWYQISHLMLAWSSKKQLSLIVFSLRVKRSYTLGNSVWSSSITLLCGSVRFVCQIYPQSLPSRAYLFTYLWFTWTHCRYLWLCICRLLIGKVLEGRWNVWNIIQVLSRHSPARSDWYYDKNHAWNEVLRPRFEHGTFRTSRQLYRWNQHAPVHLG